MDRCKAAMCGFLALTVGVTSGIGVLYAESMTGQASSPPSETSSSSAQEPPSASATPAPTGSEPTPILPTPLSLAEVELISLDILHGKASSAWSSSRRSATPSESKHRSHPAGIRCGHLWAYVGYDEGIPVRVVYRFTPTHGLRAFRRLPTSSDDPLDCP